MPAETMAPMGRTYPGYNVDPSVSQFTQVSLVANLHPPHATYGVGTGYDPRFDLPSNTAVKQCRYLQTGCN